MAIRWRCLKCKIDLSGEGASRHYLAYPKHKLVKLPPPKPAATTTIDNKEMTA
ncbi:MAG TPA: hypothetical protein VF172_09730 [Nitrososphaera sp.]|jgi:hypothetical protein